MTVKHYELDRLVMTELQPGATTPEQLKKWQGAASGIAEYVSSWGVERFWAMSRSPQLINGVTPDPGTGTDEQRRYFAWGVARVVLCRIVGRELRLTNAMTTAEFQSRFRDLSFNQQMLLTDLLLEIADTIQFWTMRLKQALDSGRDC